MLEKIPEQKTGGNTIIYSPVIKQKKSGAFVDALLTVLLIVIVFALEASYFVVFNPDMQINAKSLTLNTLWFSIGTIAVGGLTKKVAKDKGREAKEYEEAEKQANEAIKKINETIGAERVSEYCENYTTETLYRCRKYYLSTVGLTVEKYEKEFIGKGKKELSALVKENSITEEQRKAILKCGRLKVRDYDPNFILSYNSEIDSNKTPSAMYNVELEDKANAFKSVLSTLISSLFVCTMTSSILYDFSTAAIIGAITKVIMILVTVCFKASFGWNITLQEIKRNRLRASEAVACMKWCKDNPKTNGNETTDKASGGEIQIFTA